MMLSFTVTDAKSQDSLTGEKTKQFNPMTNDIPAVIQHEKRKNKKLIQS